MLQIYSPASIKALTKRLTLANDLIKAENNTPSLAYICKVMGNEQLALVLVKLHLIDLLDFLNPSRTMTMPQVEQTADLIISDYSYLKIADLLYVFKQAKKGEFGQLYEGIDGQKVLQWFTQVWGERLDAAEFQSQNEANQQKQALIEMVGDNRTSSKEATAGFREIVVNLKAKYTKRKGGVG